MEKLKQHTIDLGNKVIYIKGLYKSFDELQVLKGIDFHLFKGENIAILGKSGTGKSVLIKIIVGLLKADRGEVEVLGNRLIDLDSKELNALRLRIGFSFQNSALYDSMNVYQNLAFPLTMNLKNLPKVEIKRRVEEVLESVGLAAKINQMPSDLSGGQRKRIGIARTLILKPEIMLYDEPTSGLDPITSTEIIELINEVQQQYNTSSVIITHDLTCARNTSNRIALLLDGKFAKTGTFEEVFETNDEEAKGFYNYNFIQ
jgi:phospholipid/cholesterol/gamma-HCH transport system ATP-binding protein